MSNDTTKHADQTLLDNKNQESNLTHDTKKAIINKDEPNQQATNQPKKDNTIKIENIYASQIVEEIRRERERKVLQKRQFKKALQQKRNENQDKQQDSMQKAIDEMYAKQAHHYIGESSLDDDGFTENATDSKSEASNQSEKTSQQAHAVTSESIQENSSTPFNYEEVDLNNVQDVHNIDEEQVDENTSYDHNDTANQVEDNRHNYVSELKDIDNSDDMNESSTISSNLDDVKDKEDIMSDEAETFSDKSDVDDAQYRELTETAMASDEVANLEQSEANDEITQAIPKSNHSERQFIESEADSSIGHASQTDELDTASQEEAIDEPAESESASIQNENMNSYSETHKSVKGNDLETTDNNAEQKGTSIKNSKSSTTKKGSKPFNVVMTPSDKKRMLDAQKEKNSIKTHLNSANNKDKSEIDNTQNVTNPNQSQANNTHQQNETTTEVLNNASETQTDLNSINQSNHITNEQDDLQQNSEAPYIHDASIDATSHDTEQFQTSEHTTANELNKANNQNHAQQHHIQEPVLKPERSGSQLGGTQSSTSYDNKATIRRGPNIKLPSVELLEAPQQHEIDNSWIEDKKQELNEAFYYFNVPAEVQNVTEGPSVTRFELSVEKGVKVSRITALQDDIKMALAAKDIRIEAPIPGTSLVGIEVPNQNATTVNLRSIIEEPAFKNAESKLTVAMGLRINNEPLLMDISKTPHALIAGATGSGKSVCINSILMSLLYKNHPEELRLLLIDPKMVELAPYNDLPHLVAPVITDVKAATQSLKWAVEEMERRYKVFAKYHVRNITAFNKKATYEDRMPKIVIVIDELADLMMMAPQEVEQSIARIAQKARACGIHMLVATQRPSVNVITGLIKANIPTRIAFMVSSSVDSRTILDSGGAERLLGYGDMLYLGSGMNKPIRVQGTFVSDEEIDDVVDYIKQQREPEYLFEEKELLKKTESQPQDDLFDDVCRFMLKEGHISTSLVQRHFQIGYNRAARIIDQLEQLGYVSGANGSKPRDVYITESDLNEN